MRLWSFDPAYLDRMGLVAEWREGLLAQKVLAGLTRGYRHHPQLERFKALPDPLSAIGAFLSAVALSAEARGYSFDRGRILKSDCPPGEILVEEGQLAYEWGFFLEKISLRDTPRWVELSRLTSPRPHPLVRLVPGGIAAWERPVSGGPDRRASVPSVSAPTRP